jgi:flavodoxin
MKRSCKILLACTVAALIFTMPLAYAQESGAGKILILYYSRTGNTKLCCEALQKELGADMIEIKDLKNRSGGWGFFTGAVGSMFDVHTDIDPVKPDLSPYKNIIIASPIWTGTLSTAIRTLIDENRWDGKNVILFTTTNAAEKEKYIEKSKARVAKNGALVVGYCQIVVKKEVADKKIDKQKQEIIEDALKFVPDIKKAFSLPQLKTQ